MNKGVIRKQFAFGIVLLVAIISGVKYYNGNTKVGDIQKYKLGTDFVYDKDTNGVINIVNVEVADNPITIHYKKGTMPVWNNFTFKLVKGEKAYKPTNVMFDVENDIVEISCKDTLCSQYNSLVMYDNIKGFDKGQFFEIKLK